MLTPIQIEKLRSFTVSQKYGKLVENAIHTWTHGVGFCFARFGLEYRNLTKYKLSNSGKCCLLGAAIIDQEKSEDEHLYNGINRLLGLDDFDIAEIWRGFDCCYIDQADRYECSESFLLGYDIRQILLEP